MRRQRGHYGAKRGLTNDLRRIEPPTKSMHRTERSVRCMHRHVGAFASLIRLAPPHMHDDALAMPRDVRDIERHQLRTAKRSREAHEQQRSITQTEQS